MSRKIVNPGVDQVTHCKRGHPYTEENSYYWRRGGPAARKCRQCMRELQEASRAKAKRGRAPGLDAIVPFFQPEPWVAEAACCDADWSTFFPERGDDTRPAKAICARCPVRESCLDFALRWNIAEGIWGGLSGRQRRRFLQKRRPS